MFKLVTSAAILLAIPMAGAERDERFSSDLNDYNLSMDRDERLAVFARSKVDFAEARIMVSEKHGGEWSKPRPIGFTDPRYSDSDPWLTADGQWLYFISNRPTADRPAKKDLDIWRSHLTMDGWSAPENLGHLVNSAGPELGPELHDGILYFGSARPGGKGGLDLYQAKVKGAGFELAEPLGDPFNSAESEGDPTFSSDGMTALFWRGGKPARLMISRQTAAGWSDPSPLPETINIGPFNFTPSFMADGRHVSFASNRLREGQAEGMADIYIALLPTIPN
jgi:Tol biopolymer transport system component